MKFNIKSAHRMVNRQQHLGNDVRWENYTIVFFRGSPEHPARTAHAVASPAGAFRNGIWGFENRYDCNDKGEWNIDPRNLKRKH